MYRFSYIVPCTISYERTKTVTEMNDKQIRKILIEYLKAQKKEMRIYEEKSIGNSICDLMAVTDKLIGYEIKSDCDNYKRLAEQIRAYDKFFDLNYIVVGQSHLATVNSKVPSHWGIICIEKEKISVFRQAETNKSVSRKKQLSVLWKLELKNILIRNGLPLYAQKEKEFIAGKIVGAVDDTALQKQIAYELLHRDYSVFEGAKDYTTKVKAASVDLPVRELVDRLSESDLNDFTLDKWIELYSEATHIKEMKENYYVKKEDSRVPHIIPYTDIEVSLGAPWISDDIIDDFIYHILAREYTGKHCIYEPITGNWYIDGKNGSWIYNDTNATIKYGIPKYNALYIIEATLNLREIKLYDADKKYDEKATAAALGKQKLIVHEFKEWIWQDEDRRWQVEEAYNKMFGHYEKRTYDGSKLVFDGINENYSLYPYQRDAVQRIIESKNTLLAFDVGAGKTYIMIAAAMKMRSEGISRRNMFVVPNNIVGQWENIFTELYPKAKVLAIEPKSFKPEMRQKVLRQIKEGDYDGIIIAYSCFEMIPLTSDTIMNNAKRRLDQIKDALDQFSYNYVNGVFALDSASSKKRSMLIQGKEKILNTTNEFIKELHAAPSDKSNGITFEDLDISTLFLDEAHNYKNLKIDTKMKNLRGISTTGSKKCTDMLHKVRSVQNSESGRGVVFATGTPLCNSISDAYTMQYYLQYEDLQKSELDKFDNWIKTFARPEQVLEVDVDTSKYRMVNRISKFHNLPELSRMFSQIAIFHAINGNEELPVFNGYTDVVIENNTKLKSYMNELCKRTETIRSGKIDKRQDNMLKVSTDGRKAALDLKLVGKEQSFDKFSKAFNCVNNVLEIYNKYEGCTQLIFCDYSTPKGKDFSVYKELKEHLIERGIPESEIAFIHNYTTESKKVDLYKKFNAGEVRILIGSTFKLGIGANVQERLKAIHHLDVPWRPADMVQREGRIIRRGNKNDEILIYRYVAEGSFDSYSWQILETKQRFISQFLSGSAYQRTISDLEDFVLSYAEVKALALSEPLMKQLAELENEVKTLRLLTAKSDETKLALDKERIENNIAKYSLRNKIYISGTIQSKLESYSKSYKDSTMKALVKTLTSEYVMGLGDEQKVTALCFNVVRPEKQSEKNPYVILKYKYDDIEFTVDMGDSALGNARRVMNFLNNFEKTINETREELKKAEERSKYIEEALNSPDDNLIKLIEKENELKELQFKIKENLGK